MPTLIRYHHYRLKGTSKKDGHFIVPTSDTEVPKEMFDQYEDITEDKSFLSAMVKFDCVEETNA